MKVSLKAAAAGLSVVLAVTLLQEQPALAVAPEPYEPPPIQDEPPVPGEELPPTTLEPVSTGSPVDAPAPVWPSPEAAEVGLPTLPSGAADGRMVRAGSLPVLVGRPVDADPQASPDRVRVEVLEPGAGAEGRELWLRIGRIDGTATAADVEVAVEYDAFRHAYGGDWASRLRLVALPECALTTPGAAECAGEVIPSRNDVVNGVVSAEARVTAGGTILAVSAGTSGAAGDYSATSLQPSSTWSAGGNSGDFAWSYPLRMPPALNGPEPVVELSYSAQSVDGRMAASNNQPSWLGEGFEWSPGYIERRYVPCGSDTGNGANNTVKTGDLCWATDNAIMSLNGSATELLRAEDGTWHPRAEDGSRIVRKTGQTNGDNDGEHWIVTTADGTQYWFGRNRLPGWTSERAETNSVWEVPVFGNHDKEPCHKETFAASSCAQAWRWNLDYVVDPQGNTMSFWYAKETNQYARNRTPSDLAAYTRGGHLTRIDYGTRSDTAYGTAPMQVLVQVEDRCLSDCGDKREQNWPDTPWDLECTKAPCYVGSPTFWSTKRLHKITTRVGGSDVESWTFTHSFPDPGDGTRAGLWLDRISHTGHVGDDASVPDITFEGIQLPNRVDAVDHSPAMNWWRIAHINTETGASITVSYSKADCAPGDVPTAPHNNQRRCYPVRWTPEGRTSSVLDYFHKYVVTSVQVSDNTGASDRVLTTYTYPRPPAWRYTDDDGLIRKENKTWSEWRGYDKVITVVGEPGEQTYTETTFFRGMHGDRSDPGTRTVTLPASAGAPAVNDENAYAGMVREEITYNGPNGEEVSRVVNEPWQSEPTASRTVNGSTVHARFADVRSTWERTTLAAGGHRTTRTVTTFDDHGMAVRVEDHGDVDQSGDEQCTVTDYVRNLTDWLTSYPSRVREFATTCGRALNEPLTEDDLISDTLTNYDGKAHGVAPTGGLATRTEVLKKWDEDTQTPTYLTTTVTTYDSYGRVKSATDVRGNVTTTDYTPATGGPVTATTVTNHLGWTETTTLAPAWGLPLAEVDQNGKRTEFAYDGLGRLTAVWLPGRDKSAGHSASMTYEYRVRNNAPTVVTTSELMAAGNYVTSHELFDGSLRPRQTQEPAAGTEGGRIITDTFYDSVGRVYKTYGAYIADGDPSTALFRPTGDNEVPTITETKYDGAGRTIASVSLSYGVEKWRTTTEHDGERTKVTPPPGGTVTETVTDAHGRTVELRHYHDRAADGDFDVTTYEYDHQGRLETVTDPGGNERRNEYDLRGRLVRSVDPDGGVTVNRYNDAGDLVSTTDARGVTLAYTYDSLGRRTSIREDSVDGPVRAEWTYDVVDLNTTVLGKQVTAIRREEGRAYITAVTGFTDDYQPTGVRYTIPDEETGVGGTYTYTYGYRGDGSRSTTRLPDVDGPGGMPTETLTHGYNALGQPTTLRTNYTSNGDDAFYINGTGYTRYGELAQLGYRFGNGKIANLTIYYQDGSRRPERVLVTRETGPSLVSDTWYEFDPMGGIKAVSEEVEGDHQCFRHDYLRRLVEAWTPESGDCDATPTRDGLGGPAPYWQSWSFDEIGNRVTETDHALASPATTEYHYPQAGSPQPHALLSTSGAVTGTYTYDEAGNTLTRPTADAGTQTLTWDPEGLLASSTDDSGETTFVYDADGNRLLRRDPEGTTLYLPQQELRWTAATGARATTRYYEHAGHTVAVRTTAGLAWSFTDHQGTTERQLDANTQAVTVRRQTPYGEVRGAEPVWPGERGFLGGTRDNTGLTHLGAREYDQDTGRFVSLDPVLDLADPQQMTGYAYANHSPVTFSDPTGLLICLTPSCIGSGVRWLLQKFAPIPRAVARELDRARTEVRSALGRGTKKVRQGLGVVVRGVKKVADGVVSVKNKAARGGRRIVDGVRRLPKEVGKRLPDERAVERARKRYWEEYDNARRLPCEAFFGAARKYGCIAASDHLFDHLSVYAGGCFIFCVSATIQRGTLSIGVGLGATGLGAGVNYNSLLPSEQGPATAGVCAAAAVGVCGGAAEKVDAEGKSAGKGWYAGLAAGVGETAPAYGYTVLGLDYREGTASGMFGEAATTVCRTLTGRFCLVG